jgi:hypothetical protein
MTVWRDALLIVCAYGLLILVMLALDVFKACWHHFADRRVEDETHPPKGFRIVEMPADWSEEGWA